jgi:superfamily II DNA or RNA helicase
MLKVIYGYKESEIHVTSRSDKTEVFRFLDTELAFWVPNFQFTQAFIDRRWDGKQHLFNKKTGVFPSGLFYKVLNLLKETGVEYTIDNYPEPNDDLMIESVELGGGIQLRDYQLEPIHKSLRYHRGIWEIATNGGKTEAAAGLLKVLGIPPCIFLIPLLSLLEQTVNRLSERLGVKVYKMGGGFTEFNPHGVNVCMYHTFVKQLSQKRFVNNLAHIQVLLADECHTVSAPSYRKSVEAIPAVYRFGLSGTPFPKDDIGKYTICGIFGPVICKVENYVLMDRGISVRPNVGFLQLNQTVDKGAFEFIDGDPNYYLEGNTTRNAAIAKLAKGLVASGRQTVIMVQHSSHGLAISKLIGKSLFVDSQHPKRKMALERLKSGEVFCLICTPIFNTGVDVPHIEGLILASVGKNRQRLLQSIGRAVRVSKTKEKSLWVFDFVDHYNKSTMKHSRIRKKDMADQKAFNMVYEISKMPQDIFQFFKGDELLKKCKWTGTVVKIQPS